MTETVLVSGASGFTGGHLARRLAEMGKNVRVLVRRESNLNSLKDCPVEPVYCDLSVDEVPARAVEGVDKVYHVAAIYRRENVPDSYFRAVNVDGTRKLLDAALKAGVGRFIHTSTVGVQGDIKNPPATEEAPYGPMDEYQRTKMEGELLALKYFREKGLPGAVVRPTGIYGPGDTRFLKLYKSIYNGTFRMIGKGEVVYHWTYIDDLVDGFLLAGEKQSALGEIFTIGGPNYIPIRDLVDLIASIFGKRVSRLSIPVAPVMAAAVVTQKVCKALGVEPPLYPRRLDFFIKTRAFDISKARRLLGYEPKVDLQTGLKNTAAWYQETGLIG